MYSYLEFESVNDGELGDFKEVNNFVINCFSEILFHCWNKVEYLIFAAVVGLNLYNLPFCVVSEINFSYSRIFLFWNAAL